MKLKKDGRDGRNLISIQRSLRCVLHKPSAIFGMLAYVAVPAMSSCELLGGIGKAVDEQVKETVDSSNFTIRLVDCCQICNDSRGKILTTDIFVYGSGGTKNLEHYWREEGMPDEIYFRSSKEDKIVVAVANSPYVFNTKTVERYDSVGSIEFRRDEDDTVNPIMTGECIVEAASSSVIKLKPMMGRIVVTEVSNTMSQYRRLEDPRILLLNSNACIQAFQEDGFYPTETEEETEKVALPCDVGMFTQYPCTEIWCYPDDGEGANVTTLVLECEIKGNTCRFPVNVTPVRRNMTRTVEYRVDSEKKFSATVY